MNSDVLVALSVMVPLVCLGLLMTLSWLEDTLDDDMTTPVQISPGAEPDVAPPVPVLDVGEFPDPMATTT